VLDLLALIIAAELGYLIILTRDSAHNAEQARTFSDEPDDEHPVFPASMLHELFREARAADAEASIVLDRYMVLSDGHQRGTLLTEEQKFLVARWHETDLNSQARRDRWRRALQANIDAATRTKTIEQINEETWDIATVGAWRYEYEGRRVQHLNLTQSPVDYFTAHDIHRLETPEPNQIP
jgi:hypothetical protein